MALMCPLEGCKAKLGMCGHEKMMLGIVILVVVAFVVAKLSGVM
jgi:hypothetical protein